MDSIIQKCLQSSKTNLTSKNATLKKEIENLKKIMDEYENDSLTIPMDSTIDKVFTKNVCLKMFCNKNLSLVLDLR